MANISFAVTFYAVDGYARFNTVPENFSGTDMMTFERNAVENTMRAVVSSPEDLASSFSNKELKMVYASLVDVAKSPLPKAIKQDKLAGMVWEVMETDSNTMEVLEWEDYSPAIPVASSPRIALEACVYPEMDTEEVDGSHEGEEEKEEEEKGESEAVPPVATVPVASPVVPVPVEESAEELQVQINAKIAEMGAAMMSGNIKALQPIQDTMTALTKRLTAINSRAEMEKENEKRKAESLIAVASLRTVASSFYHSVAYAADSGEVDISHLEALGNEIAAHLKAIKGTTAKKASVTATGKSVQSPTAKGERNKPGESKAIIIAECSKPNGANPKELGELLGYGLDKHGKQMVCRVTAMEAIKSAGMVVVKVPVPGTTRVNIKAMTFEDIKAFNGTVDEKNVFIPAQGEVIPYVDAA